MKKYRVATVDFQLSSSGLVLIKLARSAEGRAGSCRSAQTRGKKMDALPEQAQRMAKIN